MNYKQAVIKSHYNLSKINGEFVEHMLQNSDMVAQQRATILNAELPKSLSYMRSVASPWPLIVDNKLKGQYKEITQRMGQLLYKSVVLMAEHYPQMYKQLYQVPIELADYVKLDDTVGEAMIGRFDGLMHNGALKLVEYNAGSNIGGWHMYRQAEVFRQITGSFGAKLESTAVLEQFFTYLNKIGQAVKTHQTGQETVNVLFEMNNPEETQECLGALDYFEQAIAVCKLNIRLFFDTNFEQIRIENEQVMMDDQVIDVITAPMFGIDSSNLMLQQLTHLHFAGKVAFPDNPVYLLSGHKSNFANLYFLMQQGLLSKQEYEMVSKYLPWTAYLNDSFNQGSGKVSESAQFIDGKDQYVIKRDGLMGGQHVYIGLYMSVEGWRNVLVLAGNEPGWSIQKFYPSDPFYSPLDDHDIIEFDLVFGFFDFGTTFGGCVIRMMPTASCNGVVNASKGAQCTMALEMPQRKALLL
ncbi:MAG: hypothetical protein ACI8WB_005043 [Phenylobacterium sp.]|jgi:hypothetical protein